MVSMIPDVKVNVERIAPYADRCPVCDGRGKVPGWFYEELVPAVFHASVADFARMLPDRESRAPETCRGCDGAGWVVVR